MSFGWARRAATAVKRRFAWIAGVALLILLGYGVSVVGLDRAFLQGLLATFIGAVLGFLVALYIDRHQRAEDAETQRGRDAAAADVRRARDAAAADTQRTLNAEAEARARDHETEMATTRRRVVVLLLRDELGRIATQMQDPVRQSRSYAPPDRLVDVLWRSLSASGELRWIEDLELLRSIAAAYDLVGVQSGLEDQWRQQKAAVGRGLAETFVRSELQGNDFEARRLTDAACKAMDAAIGADA